MKYKYKISWQYFNGEELNKRFISLYSSTGIDNTVYLINRSYLPYYIQELKKLLNGERKEELYIYVSDEEEMEQYPEEWIQINQDWAYVPEDLLTENDKKYTHRIETTELLEFFEIMKKELEIGDEVIEPNLDYWNYYFSGGHLKRSLSKERKIIETKNMNEYGCYLALQEKRFYEQIHQSKTMLSFFASTLKIPHIIKKTKWIPMFPDHFSEQEVIDSISQAYRRKPANPYKEGSKVFESVDDNGMEIYLVIQNNPKKADYNSIISAYPKI